MPTASTLQVWDPLVRVFHWLLVAAFATAYLTEDEWQLVHVWAGYTVLALVAVRLLWGFVGSRYARFSSFMYSPATVLRYLKAVWRGQAERHIGHNPAGGAMIIALLLCLLITTGSGMALYGAEQWQGPLAGLMRHTSEAWIEVIEETHEWFANFTLVLVIIHVLGVLWESWLHKENLVGAMFSGRKRA